MTADSAPAPASPKRDTHPVMTGSAAVLASLVVLAREDGRIEREVERSTGTGPVAPGRPQDPKHDLKQR